MNRKFLCQIHDVPTDTIKAFEVEGGKRILMINANDRFHACQSLCPHQDVELEEGLFDGQVLTCHQHLWQWKVDTGEPVGLAEEPLDVFRVEVEGDSVFVCDVKDDR